LGVMELKMKMFIEELMKVVRGELQSMRKDLRDDFTAQESVFNTCITELSTEAQQREEYMVRLEDAAENFDMSFTTWKLEVEASLSTVKLELSKFNSFFTPEGKMMDTSSPGIVSGGTASSRLLLGSIASGPQGHHVDSSNRDCGYGGVYTHIHVTQSRVCSTRRHPYWRTLNLMNLLI
jgi:hypothetical protein